MVVTSRPHRPSVTMVRRSGADYNPALRRRLCHKLNSQLSRTTEKTVPGPESMALCGNGIYPKLLRAAGY